MTDAPDRPRYLVADHWEHIFDDRAGPTATRFVYDREESRMLAVQYRRDQRWHEGDAATVADVADSLVNANPDALANPADWDLEETDDLPHWCEPPTAPAP